ncbi:MAG: potassium channel protein [Kosmotoga sp.]|nr:MAG: potassium channel protein [Kosmotoga sp.]
MVGYSIIQDWDPLQSFFMTIITISTVGYGTPEDLSVAGEIFTSILILASLTVVLYALSNITAFFVEGRVNQVLRRRRFLKKIEKFKKHYIIVGSGMLGRNICRELLKMGENVVVIDNNEELIKHLEETEQPGNGEVVYLLGDATDEEILENAGVKKAMGLITTLPSDADNVFVVLTARSLNKDLNIISEVTDPTNTKKLEYAGVNRTIPLPEIGAHRIVNMLLNPDIVGFLDSITRSGGLELRFEKIDIPDNFPEKGLTLEKMKIPQRTGLIVIAISDGTQSIFNPSASTVIKRGYSIMVLGEYSKIEKLRNLVNSGELST